MNALSVVLQWAQKAAILLAIYASWLIPGCVALRATTQGTDPDTVWLEVENQHSRTVSVFWIGHGTALRVGRVNALETKRMRIPSVWSYSSPIRLAISPLGSETSIALPTVSVPSGSSLKLTITNALEMSTLVPARQP
jgi:hypothetical protein